MKPIYFLIFICISVFSLKAQYTITSAANPVPGDIEHYKNLDTAGLFLGSSGMGQTWNYTSVSISTMATTPSTYVPVSSIPNNFMFPGATIGADYGSGNFDVYSNNSTKIEIIGQASSIVSNCILYSDPAKLYSLPFSYGSVSSDNFAYAANGNTVTGTFSVTGDGTGTLQLPGGSYSNVLKQHYLMYITVTMASSVITLTTVQSSYYSAASKFMLLSASTQTQSVVTGTMTSVSYNKGGQINASLVTGIRENQREPSALTVFPNPLEGKTINITFSLEASEACELNVFNSLGQIIKSFSYPSLSAGINTKNVDLSELENGIYYIRLKVGTTEQVKKISISR